MARQCTMDAVELSFIVFDLTCDGCLFCTCSSRNWHRVQVGKYERLRNKILPQALQSFFYQSFTSILIELS
jgi:MinD superfamily P-loop ATPase